MLKNILFSHQNKVQLWSAILGTFLGLLLLLGAIQLNFDIQTLSVDNQEDQFVIINKKVNIFNTIGVSSDFTFEELKMIADQDFISSIGKFTPNQYKVSATSSLMGFYTELFFESVSDQFLDIHPGKFKWEEDQNELPIIISRDYLALYNFGFAPSQGLPQFTPNTIKKVSVDIHIRGKGQRKVFSGRIVGFSDRINSILVPESFMNFANANYGSQAEEKISRLILAADNPYSTDFQSFLDDNNYEVSSGKLIGGQVGILLRIVLALLAFIGLSITVLSLLVFALNFELLISRTRSEIVLLLQLGYKTQKISQLLFLKQVVLFGGVLAGALLLVALLHYILSQWLVSQAFSLPGRLHWSVFVSAILLAILFYLVNRKLIRKKVVALF